MRLLLNSILLFILLGGCVDLKKEEQIKVGLDYEHAYRTRLISDPVPIRHHIDVLSGSTIQASADLNTNLSARVEIPVDISLIVDYKNYTSQYPDIHYEYGSSDPFYVSHHSPDSLTINIRVDVNPNYPVEETETIDNTTIDNETVDNETVIDNITYIWSDTFIKNVIASQDQQVKYSAYWDNASNDNWTSISIGSTDNMSSECDNATLINEAISQRDNISYEFRGVLCGGLYWAYGRCGLGQEINAHPTDIKDCQCNTTGYVIRPLINNKNWGGVGGSCTRDQTLDNQTLQIILKTTPK